MVSNRIEAKMHYPSVSKPGSKLYKTKHVNLRWGRILHSQDKAFLDATRQQGMIKSTGMFTKMTRCS